MRIEVMDWVERRNDGRVGSFDVKLWVEVVGSRVCPVGHVATIPVRYDLKSDTISTNEEPEEAEAALLLLQDEETLSELKELVRWRRDELREGN